MEKVKVFIKRIFDSEAIKKIIATIIAILLGLLAGLIVMLIVDPSQAFGGLTAILFDGISRGGEGFGEVLFKAAPLILTGLAVAFAFKTGLFNIGVSGQLMMGAFVAVYIGVKWTWLPGVLHFIVAALGGILTGALWALIPAILKAYRNVHEVVATIMMNYIAMFSSNMLVQALIYDQANTSSMAINKNARVPNLLLDKIFPYPSINGGIIFAIIVGVIIYIILKKTTFGYELKAVGLNRNAARYAGINDKQKIMFSLLISGAIAGLAGAIIYLVPGSGQRIQLTLVISPYGFQGIAVALLGMSNPIGTVFAGLYLGYIEASNQTLQSWGFKREIIDIISASIIYFSAFALYFQKHSERIINKIKELIRRRSEKHEKVSQDN